MAHKAVFFDRDDTLIEDCGYINSPEQVKLLPGAAEALIQLRQMGYMLVVVSNQSAVARGIVTEEILEHIHQRLYDLLAEKGAFLDKLYYCPYHPDGAIEKYRQESDWRKPKPGMLLKAAEEMDIELGQSWMIGDSDRDILAGKRAGCRTIFVNPPPAKAAQANPPQVIADYKAVNIKEAVNIIKRHNQRQQEKPLQQKEVLPKPSEAAVVTPKPAPVVAEKPVPAAVEKPQQQPSQPAAAQKPVVPTPAKITIVSNQNTPVRPQAMESEQAQQTNMLLEEIVKQLKIANRSDMFHEFSIFKLMSGILFLPAAGCLLISFWYVMDPMKKELAFLAPLGFAIVLQLMSLTLYIMHERK